MSANPVKEVLSDLFPYLESLEAKCAAMLAFLKEKEIATDEQLAPYLERAKDSSGVKWHAARMRMEHLLAVMPEDNARPSDSPKETALKSPNENGTNQASSDSAKSTSAGKDSGPNAETASDSAKSGKPDGKRPAKMSSNKVESEENVALDSDNAGKQGGQPSERPEKDAA